MRPVKYKRVINTIIIISCISSSSSSGSSSGPAKATALPADVGRLYVG